MNFNWNVYKLFKNGKRAKAPIHSFHYEGDEESAIAHFKSCEINALAVKNGEKVLKSKYQVVSAEGCQDREVLNAGEQKFTTEKNRVLARILKEKNIETKNSCVGALVYFKESGWMWQWAAIEGGSSAYIAGLSERFKSYNKAYDWMKEQIDASQD
jgi:hypothetical protein